MVKSIRGKGAVRCREIVRFSEGPLLEVLLYFYVVTFFCHHIQHCTSDYILMRAMETVGSMQPTEPSFLNIYIHSSSSLMFRPKEIWSDEPS